MKKYLLLLPFLCVLGVQAQIQVEHIDLSIGDVIYLSVDSMCNFDLLESGADKHWDMSNLNAMRTDSIVALEPSATSHGNHFPEASFAIGTGTVAAYSSLTDDAFVNLGFGGAIDTLGINTYLKFAYPDTQIVFPINYGDSRETYAWGTNDNITVEVPNLGQQTAKLSHSFQRSTNCDAWGTLQTTLGTFDVLRVQEKIITIDSVFMVISFMPPYFLENYSRFDTSYVYTFYTNDASIHFPLAIVKYAPENNRPLVASWVTSPETKICKEPFYAETNIYPNPAKQRIKIESPEQVDLVELFNTNGQKILQNQENTIDISSLPAGLYFVKINANEKHLIKKLTVL